MSNRKNGRGFNAEELRDLFPHVVRQAAHDLDAKKADLRASAKAFLQGVGILDQIRAEMAEGRPRRRFYAGSGQWGVRAGFESYSREQQFRGQGR